MAENQQRQQWLSVLSRSTLESIQKLWQALMVEPEYQLLKAPESGMVMVKAKAGGSGQAFNMGEMTVTRTVVQLSTGEIGYGYTQGRDKKKSELIAVIDACIQLGDWGERILQNIIRPLEEQLTLHYQQRQNETDASKVNFFTMVRGE